MVRGCGWGGQGGAAREGRRAHLLLPPAERGEGHEDEQDDGQELHQLPGQRRLPLRLSPAALLLLLPPPGAETPGPAEVRPEAGARGALEKHVE